ncbi:hypothetical protein B566_EDAN015792 [Ephemera danica]|nr:hypothetical protein B566_EDAN015792 [Ephemera danica]
MGRVTRFTRFAGNKKPMMSKTATMEERATVFCAQLKAMTIRNILLKKREKRKTIAEVFLPLYFLGILILIKLIMPNPNFPEMSTQRGDASLFEKFQQGLNHTVAVVPNTTETMVFLENVNEVWLRGMQWEGPGQHPIEFLAFGETHELLAHYWKDPMSIPIAVIFEGDPLNGPLSYEIRTNPNYVATPSTSDLYASHAVCRLSESYWASLFPIETGESCPVNQYFYSGFVALQALLDYTKIRLESGREDVDVPHILLEIFPKEAYTGDWMLVFRLIIPLYMVMALSQFITLSWFIIYALFVLVLSVISTVLLFTLQVFQHTHFVPVFLTAGILGNFAVNIMSLLYFIQVFVDDSSSVAFWIVSLISPTGFALAMDKALVLDLSGEGVSFENLWSGPGIPFGGSLPSFWCPPRASNMKQEVLIESAAMNGGGSCNLADDADVEPVPREMKGREAIRIVDLYKSYHSCRRPDVKAVNGINLTIYEGQITAILGHNGAGKTSLFNILTGLTAPTSGTALIFGLDIRNPNDMASIRRMTGVCPQHDILFDLLTPREHLVFFAAVRGIPAAEVEFEVLKTLRDVDLLEKADTRAKNLSGGQKRKLSVGIAVIGDPRIIILDEPTAGVDPYSRRHMWSVLQNRRHGKVILLTTHFMDEADILADRKAVVSRGRLRCCGSSLFLKNKFGIGYHLTMVLDGSGKERHIARLVKGHVGKAERARRHGRELSFILPHDSVGSFSALFSAIEAEIKLGLAGLGISSYGVSMTTLEEVFLHLERDESEEGTVENLSKKMVRSRALSRSLSLQSKTSYQSLQNEPLEDESRNDVTAATAVDRDAVDVAIGDGEAPPEHIGLVFSSVRTQPRTMQTLRALIWLRVLRLVRDYQKLYFMIALPLLFAGLGLYLNGLQMDTSSVKSLRLGRETYGSATRLTLHNASGSPLNALVSALEEQSASLSLYNGSFAFLLHLAPHLAAFNVSSCDVSANTAELEVTIVYNDTAQHSLPVALNLVSNAFYRLVLAEQGLEAPPDPITTRTLPLQVTSEPVDFNIGLFSSSILIGMIFLLVPVSLACDMVYDREIRAKNQLRVNGLSFFMYFSTYFIVLGALMVIICAALLGLIFVFDLPALRAPPAFITLGVLVLLYCPAAVLFCTVLSYIFDKTDSAQAILPNVATIFGLVPFSLVALVDMFKLGGRTAFALHAGHGVQGRPPVGEEISVENADVGEHEDADVQAERRKVNDLMSSGAPDPPVVIVQNLRKEYTRSLGCRDAGDSDSGKVAVRNLSLAVDAGEVFGLLGHNGAGKTTTMKIMIAEEAASRGRRRVVDSFLAGLQISEHAHKQTQHCSGGTRRKLSFAMAMVGGPCVVLMDEPSTGMDPRSKRFLWDTILASFQEADALCSRVGIMVKGELRQLFVAKTELDVEEYCFSQTTLEQVFLKFAQYDEVVAASD